MTDMDGTQRVLSLRDEHELSRIYRKFGTMTREEAIKAIKAWDFLDNDEKEAIETLIPELKEPEDEEIRQAMINFFKSERIKDGIAVLHFGVNIEKMIAWLERQAPKPKWTEEDERGSDETIELLEYFINYAPDFRRPAIRRSIDWLKSLKQRMEEQQ